VFTHDFEADLRALDFFGRPFALARFADGEMACIEAKGYTPFGKMYGTETWDTRRPSKYPRHMREALACKLPRYAVGLPTICCHPSCWLAARKIVRQVPEWTTYSSMFSFANRPRFLAMAEQLRLRQRCVLVSGVGGDLSVPLDLYNRKDFDLADLIAELRTIRDKPILVAAGPMAGVIVHRYWASTPEQDRCTIVDIGSAWDRELHGKPTRSDMQDRSKKKNHNCKLHGARPCFDGCALTQ